MMGPSSGLDARFAFTHVALDVLDDDDGVVDHEAHRQHDGEHRQEIETEAEGIHHDRRADERHRHRDERHEGRADRAHEDEYGETDDEDRLDERLRDFLERVAHEHRAVPDETHLDVLRQRGSELVHGLAQPISDVELVRADHGPDAEIDAFVLVVARDEVRLLGAQLDARDVSQPHDRAVALGHDQIGELIDGPQIRVSEQVDLHLVALRLADRGEIVVALERGMHVARSEVESG
jgi:hypothetical protein